MRKNLNLGHVWPDSGTRYQEGSTSACASAQTDQGPSWPHKLSKVKLQQELRPNYSERQADVSPRCAQIPECTHFQTSFKEK